MTEEKIIYKIVDSNTGNFAGAYSRACHTEYEFDSVCSARGANIHGMYKDKKKYKIQKWKVTYELIDEDCDPATDDDNTIFHSDFPLNYNISARDLYLKSRTLEERKKFFEG